MRRMGAITGDNTGVCNVYNFNVNHSYGLVNVFIMVRKLGHGHFSTVYKADGVVSSF